MSCGSEDNPDSCSPLEGERLKPLPQAAAEAWGGDPSRFKARLCKASLKAALGKEPLRFSSRQYDKRTLTFAKTLRRKMTDAEKKLWKHLHGKQLENYKFRRQQPVGSYIADFVCQQYRLIVEIDGSQHLDNPRDDVRTRWLQEQGCRVLRFWNNEVLKNTESVAETILEALHTTPGIPSASTAASQAEGK